MLDIFETPEMQTPDYREAQESFETNAVAQASRRDLQRYLLAISQNVTGDDAVQARDIVQALTLNHLILQRHSDELQRRGQTTQRLVIALTIASLLGTAIQSWFAYKSDVRSAQESSSKSAHSPSVASPNTTSKPVDLPSPTAPSPTAPQARPQQTQ
jgi:hypothetical protein